MSEIKVSCNDQVLKITDAPVLAAGGLNEVKVVFTFCEKWTGYVKTATFWREPDNIYFAVLDENDTCVVPWEVCYEEGTFFFGVFGEKQNSRRTSTTMRYKTKDGAISSEMLPSDPTPGVYDQIMALVAEALEHSNTISEDAEKAIEAAEQATADALSATESANNSATNASRAAEEANKAATAASNASNAVSTAVDNAIIATNNANNAVDRANSATNNASAAAGNAASAASIANEAARSANTAAVGANNAKDSANEAAQKANNAADSANASASNAATEANRASIAASSANNAATEARAAAETATNTFNGFVEDVATTLEEIHDLVEHYVDAPAIVCEASGETVTIGDASDQPLRGLKLYGKSVQNGTPTPENPVEIESVGDGGSVLAVAGGNNHFAGLEYSWTTTNATEYKFSDNNNFTITYKGGTGSIQLHCMLDAAIYRGKAITLSWGEWIQSNPAVIGRVFLQVYGANSTLLKNKFVNSKSGIKSLTIDVVPKEAVSIMLLFRVFQDDEGGAAPSVGNSAQFVNVQLGIGSEPKAYEPGNTPISATISTPGGLLGIPVSSGGNYTDANGQRWICDEMDFARGVKVQRVGKVEDRKSVV